MLPKLEFLWDEEKNTKLLKQFLIGTLTASTIAIVFILILPKNFTSHWLFLLADPITFIIFAISILLLKFTFNKKISSGFLLLSTLLYLQGATVWFLALTGGFQSITQFTPFALMMLAIFLVGSEGTLILGIFSTLTLLGLYFWLNLYSKTSTTPQELFFYLGIYIVLALLLRSLGKELSVQIEARKKLEQVDDLKNQFITLSSHYLRTPLAVIKGGLSEVQKFVFTLPNSKTQQDARISLDQININIRQLEGLIDKFLLIASIERGQTQILFIPSDLNIAVTEIVENLEPLARDQRVRLYLEPQTIKIQDFPFDLNKIKGVISSIIENGLTYNKIGGSVNVSLLIQNNWVAVRIADSGIGMSKNQIGSIFTAFNKGGMDKVLNFDKPGIGLSLYLAKLIVEAHRGKIDVQSEEGRGSVFTVWLPIK